MCPTPLGPNSVLFEKSTIENQYKISTKEKKSQM